MEDDIPVKISDEITLSGRSPIVLLGPNGSGKTRHAVTMMGWNSADMIGALRNIALPPNVSMEPLAKARTQLRSTLDRRRSQPWELSNEISQLFSKLMAEDSASAIRFRDRFGADSSAPPETTKLMRLAQVWTQLFPSRHIDFAGHQPMVRSDYSAAAGEYPAQQMSDGERVALYLAGRVLDSESRIIIVDEPEVHFHSRLAVRFWNELESLRPECRFVYITHDLPFALSRRGAEFAIVMPDKPPQVVALEEGIPRNLAEALLAAASFSIHARRIVFCEGVEGHSRDQQLYAAWFSGPDTAVVPVGSSSDVVRCTRAFGESKLVAGVEAEGIIDRDYWPDQYLDSLPSSISALPVHEVENLLCLKDVFLAVAKHVGVAQQEAQDRYTTFLERSAASFDGSLFAKQVSERYRRRCEHELLSSLNSLRISGELSEMRQQQMDGVDPQTWGTLPGELFDDERQRLEDALVDEGGGFLTYFPGKVFIKTAAETLGLEVRSLIDLVCSALFAKGVGPLGQLGSDLEGALEHNLPSRWVQDDPVE